MEMTIGTDPLTQRWVQVTRRGFRSAAEAARARRELLMRSGTGLLRPTKDLASAEVESGTQPSPSQRAGDTAPLASSIAFAGVASRCPSSDMS